MLKKRVVVPLAEGFEEIEAVTIVDVLRRAGLDVVMASVTGNPVTGSHGITVTADLAAEDVDPATIAALVLPGGMPGAEHLTSSPVVQELIERVHAAGGRIGAICAAPMALAPSGLASRHAATSYPGFEERVGAREYRQERVVVSDRVITSRGPGTALEFALTLVAELLGPEPADRLRAALLVS